MTFSERVKPLKEKSKLTLLEIATACNISESMASRYINGQTIPPEDIARKIVDFLSAAVPSETKSNEARSDAFSISSVYEARISDLKANIIDLKAQLSAEKKEKWAFIFMFIVVICLAFLLMCVDITNGNIGWFRR